MSKKWGLPTFPIADGMRVNKRSMEELEWLMCHGTFVSWHHHHVLVKLPNARYRLYRNTQPVAQIEAEAATLYELIRDNNIPIALYQWHDHREDEV